METLERPPHSHTPLSEVDRKAGMQLLLKTIAERRGTFDSLAHIPRDIVMLMKKAGIFRAGTPKKFGGDALEPAKFLEMVERIAVVDGSAAWVAAFGSANTYLAALPEATQAKIYATGPDQVFAGGLYPLQDAQRVDGGWRVSGRWKFASGCKGADWIGVGIKGETKDASGKPVVTALMALSPANEVEIVDNWNVVGMQGTGSHDTLVQDKFYADEWTCLRGGSMVIDEPLYRYPALAYQAQVHAACNLGLARAALDIVAEMANAARLMPNMARLSDRGYFRTGLARGEAQLRSAQLFFYEAAERGWASVLCGDPVPAQDANMMRLSAAHAAHAAAEVVQQAYRIAGMSAIHRGHRMQQIVRDTMVVTQHAALSESIFESAGAMLAGADAGPAYP
jgi:alkylation response protein AidB-like acyl-CoA dehydrogenase